MPKHINEVTLNILITADIDGTLYYSQDGKTAIFNTAVAEKMVGKIEELYNEIKNKQTSPETLIKVIINITSVSNRLGLKMDTENAYRNKCAILPFLLQEFHNDIENRLNAKKIIYNMDIDFELLSSYTEKKNILVSYEDLQGAFYKKIDLKLFTQLNPEKELELLKKYAQDNQWDVDYKQNEEIGIYATPGDNTYLHLKNSIGKNSIKAINIILKTHKQINKEKSYTPDNPLYVFYPEDEDETVQFCLKEIKSEHLPTGTKTMFFPVDSKNGKVEILNKVITGNGAVSYELIKEKLKQMKNPQFTLLNHNLDTFLLKDLANAHKTIMQNFSVIPEDANPNFFKISTKQSELKVKLPEKKHPEPKQIPFNPNVYKSQGKPSLEANLKHQKIELPETELKHENKIPLNPNVYKFFQGESPLEADLKHQKEIESKNNLYIYKSIGQIKKKDDYLKKPNVDMMSWVKSTIQLYQDGMDKFRKLRVSNVSELESYLECSLSFRSLMAQRNRSDAYHLNLVYIFCIPEEYKKSDNWTLKNFFNSFQQIVTEKHFIGYYVLDTSQILKNDPKYTPYDPTKSDEENLHCIEQENNKEELDFEISSKSMKLS